MPVTVSGEQFNTVNIVDIVMGGEGLLDGQAHEEGGSRDDSRDRDEERKARNRAALKKFREEGEGGEGEEDGGVEERERGDRAEDCSASAGEVGNVHQQVR